MAKRDRPEHYFSMTRNKPAITFFRIAGQRYCETCRTYQPRGNTKAFKGWKCYKCRTKQHEP